MGKLIWFKSNGLLVVCNVELLGLAHQRKVHLKYMLSCVVVLVQTHMQHDDERVEGCCQGRKRERNASLCKMQSMPRLKDL
jgi:hypothetical protein